MNELPATIKRRIEDEEEVCICNEDYTKCLCCETSVFPTWFACDLVIDGEEVIGPATSIVDLTTDGKGGVKVNRFDTQRQYK